MVIVRGRKFWKVAKFEGHICDELKDRVVSCSVLVRGTQPCHTDAMLHDPLLLQQKFAVCLTFGNLFRMFLILGRLHVEYFLVVLGQIRKIIN